MINLEMNSALAYDEFTVYDVRGQLNGSVEVQFDNGEFNGKILFSEDGQEYGEEEWNPLTDEKLYEFIKDKAIKDYNGIK